MDALQNYQGKRGIKDGRAVFNYYLSDTGKLTYMLSDGYINISVSDDATRVQLFSILDDEGDITIRMKTA